MIIPIRTETDVRTVPWGNLALLTLNMVAYLVFDTLGSSPLRDFKYEALALHADYPFLWQYVTYQFLHGDVWHLAGNMLFLWVFGNAVNQKLGHLPYVLFYVAGGAFAAWGFSLSARDPMVGASGSIAAVTSAYAVLFPRSRVLVLYVLILVGFFEVPALVMIGAKIILWDNIVAPMLGAGDRVAFAAHLWGYLFGTIATMALLVVRGVPRDQFDLLALFDRWHRRRGWMGPASGPTGPPGVRRASPSSPPARPVTTPVATTPATEELRRRIRESVSRGDLQAALENYERWSELGSDEALPEGDLLRIARQFYATGRMGEAASAFERFLAAYPTGSESAAVRLLLGILYAREHRDLDRAETHLTQARLRLVHPDHIEQCDWWLRELREDNPGS